MKSRNPFTEKANSIKTTWSALSRNSIGWPCIRQSQSSDRPTFQRISLPSTYKTNRTWKSFTESSLTYFFVYFRLTSWKANWFVWTVRENTQSLTEFPTWSSMKTKSEGCLTLIKVEFMSSIKLMKVIVFLLVILSVSLLLYHFYLFRLVLLIWSMNEFIHLKKECNLIIDSQWSLLKLNFWVRL